MPPTNLLAMRLRCYIPIVCIIVVASTSCSGPTLQEKKQRQLLAKLDSSMARELVFIDNQTNILYSAIEERLTDPATAERTKHWYSVTEKIREYSSTLTNYIEGISKRLEKSNTNNVLLKEVNGDSLYKALAAFKHTALNAHELLMVEFGSSVMPTIDTSIERLGDKASYFTHQNFAYLNNKEAQALLRYWQKEVLATEYRLIHFCFVQTTTTNFCGFTIESLLIGQSHSTLLPGEKLTITAGIGSFSLKPNLKIYINGKIADLTDNAFTLYDFKVPKQRGSYTIPVDIEYLALNGQKMSYHKSVTYKVQ